MRFGSLFAGIGGIDLGLERAGMECAWQVEIDDYCRRVLTKHWPDVPKIGDINGCGAHNLAPVDLIAGGFPCQDISLAGKGAGIDGERSGLWKEYHRIICELRPQYVLVENVSALLVRGIDRVLGDLVASGYDAQWDCIPASAVGAPHRRDRVFIIAHAVGDTISIGRCGGTRWRAGPEPADGHMGDEARAVPNTVRSGCGTQRQGRSVCQDQQFGQTKTEIPNATSPGLEVGLSAERLREFAATVGARQWAAEPALGCLVDGIPDGVVRFAGRVDKQHPDRVNKLRGFGNAVVPQVAELHGLLIMEMARSHQAQEAR